MRQLLLLRHAKSSWKDSTLSDHERPLNKRGRAAARSMGELVARRGLLPDLILASSAVRVSETIEILRRYFSDKVADPIRLSAKVAESPSHHKTIFEYAPRSAGAKDYTNLIERVSLDG